MVMAEYRISFLAPKNFSTPDVPRFSPELFAALERRRQTGETAAHVSLSRDAYNLSALARTPDTNVGAMWRKRGALDGETKCKSGAGHHVKPSA